MEACWAHNPEVGRSKLPPAIFFPRLSERKGIESYLTNQHERIRRDLNYTAAEEPQNPVDSFHKNPEASRMAQWQRARPITQRSVDRNYLLLIFFQ